MSPRPPPSNGLPTPKNQNTSASAAASTVEEEDTSDFNDWNDNTTIGIEIVPSNNQAATTFTQPQHPPLPSPPPARFSTAHLGIAYDDVQQQQQTSAVSHYQQAAPVAVAPQPPPEPDFFGSMNMNISSDVVNQPRAAPKKPLTSSTTPKNALSDPTRNLYAAAHQAATSNAQSSRFTDDLLEQSLSDTRTAKSAASAWADGDLDDLLGGGSTNDKPTAKKAAQPKKPREPKKPRGIGAVAVALDDEV